MYLIEKMKGEFHMPGNLFETHITVADLDESARFYENAVGLEPAWTAEGIRFYWIGGKGKAMLGLWQQRNNGENTRLNGPDVTRVVPQHLAFGVSAEELRIAMKALIEKGVKVRNFLNDGKDCLYVHAWMPAVSFYFSDPDGHVLEFIAMLPDEPRPELGIVEWSRWETMHGRTQ